MTEQRNWLKRFVEDFGKVPEEEPTPLVPQKWAIPVYSGIAIVALILLALFVWLIVIPAIQAPAATPLSMTPSRFVLETV